MGPLIVSTLRVGTGPGVEPLSASLVKAWLQHVPAGAIVRATSQGNNEVATLTAQWEPRDVLDE